MISNFVIIMWVIMVLIAIGLILKGLSELAYWTGYYKALDYALDVLEQYWGVEANEKQDTTRPKTL